MEEMLAADPAPDKKTRGVILLKGGIPLFVRAAQILAALDERTEPLLDLGPAQAHLCVVAGVTDHQSLYQQLTLEGLFPSEMEQISMIDRQAESEKPSAFAITCPADGPPSPPA